jgi:uncharacterized protein (TIGR03905 family)
MKKYRYETAPDVCSSAINLTLSDDGETIIKAEFEGGCPGSLTAVGLLAAGKKVDEAIELLQDVPCGSKKTSCPAQLALMLKKIKNM